MNDRFEEVQKETKVHKSKIEIQFRDLNDKCDRMGKVQEDDKD